MDDVKASNDSRSLHQFEDIQQYLKSSGLLPDTAHYTVKVVKSEQASGESRKTCEEKLQDGTQSKKEDLTAEKPTSVTINLTVNNYNFSANNIPFQMGPSWGNKYNFPGKELSPKVAESLDALEDAAVKFVENRQVIVDFLQSVAGPYSLTNKLCVIFYIVLIVLCARDFGRLIILAVILYIFHRMIKTKDIYEGLEAAVERVNSACASQGQTETITLQDVFGNEIIFDVWDSIKEVSIASLKTIMMKPIWEMKEVFGFFAKKTRLPIKTENASRCLSNEGKVRDLDVRALVVGPWFCKLELKQNRICLVRNLHEGVPSSPVYHNFTKRLNRVLPS